MLAHVHSLCHKPVIWRMIGYVALEDLNFVMSHYYNAYTLGIGCQIYYNIKGSQP